MKLLLDSGRIEMNTDELLIYINRWIEAHEHDRIDGAPPLVGADGIVDDEAIVALHDAALLEGNESRVGATRTSLTARQFYAYLLHTRRGQPSVVDWGSAVLL